jgi:hypothetical protein
VYPALVGQIQTHRSAAIRGGAGLRTAGDRVGVQAQVATATEHLSGVLV